MTPVVKSGVTFVLGAMCGALITRGFQRFHRHEALRRWSCARRILEKQNALKRSEGKGNEEAAKTVVNDVGHSPM